MQLCLVGGESGEFIARLASSLGSRIGGKPGENGNGREVISVTQNRQTPQPLMERPFCFPEQDIKFLILASDFKI